MATPKKPQDRKPKAAELEIATDPSETPGWELMKPLDEIPVWDQTDLIGLLMDVQEDGERKRAEKLEAINEARLAKGLEALEELEDAETDFDIRLIGKLAQAIRPHAKDDKEFLKFMSGAGAMERAGTLGMAWVGQMGESMSSAAS